MLVEWEITYMGEMLPFSRKTNISSMKDIKSVVLSLKKWKYSHNSAENIWNWKRIGKFYHSKIFWIYSHIPKNVCMYVSEVYRLSDFHKMNTPIPASTQIKKWIIASSPGTPLVHFSRLCSMTVSWLLTSQISIGCFSAFKSWTMLHILFYMYFLL